MTENYSPPLPPTTLTDPALTDPALTDPALSDVRFDDPGPALDPASPGAYEPAASGSTDSASTGDTKEVAKGQAAQVGQGAAEAGQHVAGVAKEQGAQVAREAGQQAKELASQAQTQLKEQAGAQQQKLAGGLKALGSQLSALADGNPEPGVASDLARQAADRTHSIAGWLDGREPGDVLTEISSFARRRPGAFLTAAAGIGFLAGRLTRGLQANASDDSTSAATGNVGTPTPGDGPAYAQTPPLAPVAGYGDPALDVPPVPPVAPAPGYLSETR